MVEQLYSAVCDDDDFRRSVGNDSTHIQQLSMAEPQCFVDDADANARHQTTNYIY